MKEKSPVVERKYLVFNILKMPEPPKRVARHCNSIAMTIFLTSRCKYLFDEVHQFCSRSCFWSQEPAILSKIEKLNLKPEI
jgi:hypothetical protein